MNDEGVNYDGTETEGYYKDPEPLRVNSIPLRLDPASFTPKKGIMTRYSKKLLEEGAKYYHRVTIGDVQRKLPPS